MIILIKKNREIRLPTDYTKLNWEQRKIVREQYIEQQNWMCMFCGSHLNDPPPEEITEKEINWRKFPREFLKHKIHLQHCHDTNMTEGAVHAYCNAVMWQYHGK